MRRCQHSGIEKRLRSLTGFKQDAESWFSSGPQAGRFGKQQRFKGLKRTVPGQRRLAPTDGLGFLSPKP